MATLVDSILGSGIDYVTLAVPFFFLLIGIEFIAGLVQHKRLYRFNDSINDLSCGIVDQIVGIFLKAVLFAGYLYQGWLGADRGEMPSKRWPWLAEVKVPVPIFRRAARRHGGHAQQVE